jgi:hypothetical protein
MSAVVDSADASGRGGGLSLFRRGRYFLRCV